MFLNIITRCSKNNHNFNKNVKTKPSFVSELVVHGNFMPINDGSSRFVGRLKSVALRLILENRRSAHQNISHTNQTLDEIQKKIKKIQKWRRRMVTTIGTAIKMDKYSCGWKTQRTIIIIVLFHGSCKSGQRTSVSEGGKRKISYPNEKDLTVN